MEWFAPLPYQKVRDVLDPSEKRERIVRRVLWGVNA